jgi:predicted secreted protein
MPTESISGLDGGLYIDSDKVAECKDLTLTINHTPQDATSADSAGFEESIGGLRNWQVAGSFNLIVGDADGFQVLETALLGGTSVASVKARSTATGKNYTGSVMVTQAQLNLFDLRNPQAVRWTLKGNGVLEEASS